MNAVNCNVVGLDGKPLPAKERPAFGKRFRRFVANLWDVTLGTMWLAVLCAATGFIGTLIVQGFKSPWDMLWTLFICKMLLWAIAGLRRELRS